MSVNRAYLSNTKARRIKVHIKLIEFLTETEIIRGKKCQAFRLLECENVLVFKMGFWFGHQIYELIREYQHGLKEILMVIFQTA